MDKIKALKEKQYKQEIFNRAICLVNVFKLNAIDQDSFEKRLESLFKKYNKAKSTCTKHRFLREELFVTPEKDLFGDDLHTPILEELRKLEKL